jgi:ABC-type transporter Mla MlaB component
MTSVKIKRLHSLLKGLFNHHEHPCIPEMGSSLETFHGDVDVKYQTYESETDHSCQQEALIKIGPKLNIQASINLLNSYKNISPQTKTIHIDLQGAQTAHGAVIQTLLVIQKTCTTSGKLFLMSGLTSELMFFFHLAGLNELQCENQGIEKS